eukprot:CAMPEP_0201738862 /NCGR_PEP_ID=MMETSP0593-20130828/45468_1 /ASSEMBLY_ACC=CAM_ASM_000672 /TAXON_ID=267983 /ORGANISM="Skeletonema japonicum, Strain CCMP2506" /LENGTH=261 /DNA_ID=CAMNT_0048233093 /DNA_START=429 /DNA_END=1214 /DNA_ORIENTATION=-
MRIAHKQSPLKAAKTHDKSSNKNSKLKIVTKERMRIAHKLSPLKAAKTHDKSSNKNSKLKIVPHKIVSTVCEGDVVTLVGEAANGTTAYLGSDLNLDEMDGYVSTYYRVDEEGNTFPRAKGSSYKAQCALFAVPIKQNDDADDDEEDGLDGEAETDIISEATVERVKDICVKFAKNFENNSKKWPDTKNKATFGYVANTKYSKLVDLIGKHSTYDAVAKLYGGYFDDGSFSDIAEDVIPLYFHDGENVERAIKELEFRHRN